MKSAKISQSGSESGEFSMLSATMKMTNIHAMVPTRPITMPTATAQPLTWRGSSGPSAYGLLTGTGSQNTA
jgi:hypothetical protein